MAILHYNQYAPLTPWNGFAVQTQTYRAFDSTGTPPDKRRNVILVGQQRDVLTGALVNDRSGSPLIFTVTIDSIRKATEATGARVYKWPVDPNHVSWNSNDFAWFRLGEMYLIKAEVENELGNPATALQLLNALRARRDTVAAPLPAVSRPVILRERLFELLGEGKRRQDLIRFGQYTGRVDDPSLVGGKTARPDYYVLMPVPQSQIDANPRLCQNPGYGTAACP